MLENWEIRKKGLLGILEKVKRSNFDKQTSDFGCKGCIFMGF